MKKIVVKLIKNMEKKLKKLNKEMINLETMFISDTHLYHKNILTYSPLRIEYMKSEKIDTQEEILIRNINLNKGKTIIHCGDLFFGKNGETHLLKQIEADLFLIKGNHDNFTNQKFIDNDINLINEEFIFVDKFKNDKELLKIINEYNKLPCFNFMLFEINNKIILASHFPIISDGRLKYLKQTEGLKEIFDYCKCDLNIHGHVHDYDLKEKLCFNVSVENIDMKPISLREILIKKNLI